MRPSQIPAGVRWSAVVAVAAVILSASITDSPVRRGTLGPLGLVGLDKWLHAVAFAGLALALAFALADSPRSDLAVIGLVVGVSLAYGLGIELLQRAVPSREFDLADLAADAVGTAVVVVGWRLVVRARRTRRALAPG